MAVLLTKRAESQLKSLAQDNKSISYFLEKGYWKKEGMTISDFILTNFKDASFSRDDELSFLKTKDEIYISNYYDCKIFYTRDSQNFIIIEIVRDFEIKESSAKLKEFEKKEKLTKSIKAVRAQKESLEIQKKNLEKVQSQLWIVFVLLIVLPIIVLIIYFSIVK